MEILIDGKNCLAEKVLHLKPVFYGFVIFFNRPAQML